MIPVVESCFEVEYVPTTIKVSSRTILFLNLASKDASSVDSVVPDTPFDSKPEILLRLVAEPRVPPADETDCSLPPT
jgi:hypothetical protein